MPHRKQCVKCVMDLNSPFDYVKLEIILFTQETSHSLCISNNYTTQMIIFYKDTRVNMKWFLS